MSDAASRGRHLEPAFWRRCSRNKQAPWLADLYRLTHLSIPYASLGETDYRHREPDNADR
jgi:hypothetical protein